MKKRIEEGCTAIIVKGAQDPRFPTNVGVIVKVGKFIGDDGHKFLNDFWEVDKPMFYANGMSDMLMPESHMERIDYDDIEESNHTYNLVESEE